ncbi:MAG: hypothetical protein LBU64_04465 [Planctomycetota bacterium]|nr:hypothetical protein [Planctomycetota bacterium]
MKFIFSIVMLTLFGFAGCEYGDTTPAAMVAPEYVPSVDYSAYPYDKLVAMHQELSRKERNLIIAQEQRREASKKQEFWWGVGKGDGVEKSELARIRGEKDAIMEALQLRKLQPGI